MKNPTKNPIACTLTASAIIAIVGFIVSVKVSEGVTEQKFINVKDRFDDIVSRLNRIENKLDKKD
jgi:hypothetical protein